MLLESIKLAMQAIRRNALRSFLTLLGIVIGVAAVIAMITIGAGTTVKVRQDISKLGSNLLIVRSGPPPSASAVRIAERLASDQQSSAVAVMAATERVVSSAPEAASAGMMPRQRSATP